MIAILIGIGVLLLVMLFTWIKIKLELKQNAKNQQKDQFLMEVKRNTKAREIAKQGDFGLSSLATPRASIISITPINEGYKKNDFII